MAEIDNDFQIELFGGLDISKSKSKINADIETLKKQIKELEISAKIDTNVSKNLEKQLNNLSIKLSDVKVEPKALTKMVGEINNALRGIQIPNINIGNGSNNLPNQAKQAGQQVGEIIGKEAQKAIDNVLSDSIGKAFKIRPNVSNNFKKEIENLVSDWTNGKGSVKDIKIQTKTSYDKDLDANVEKLQQATVTYRNELDEVIKKTIALRQTGTSVDLKGNESPVYGFVEVASQYSKSLDEINTKTDTFIEKQKKAVSQAQIALNSAQSGYQDKNASKPIKSNEHITALEQQYSVVKTAINNLGSASKSNFTDMQNEVDKQIAKLQDMVSVFRNAETVATSLRSKDIGTVKEQYSSKLDVLVGKMKSSGVYTDGFKSGADNLKNVLSNAVDASGLVTFLNGLDKLDAGFKRAKASADEFNKAQKVKINVSGLESKLADLERLNPEIKNFKTQIAGVDVTIDSLLSDLSKINTQGDFSVINTKFKAFRDAAKAAGYAVNDVVINSKKIDNIKISLGNGDYATQIERMKAQFQQYGLSVTDAENKVSGLRSALSNMKGATDENLGEKFQNWQNAVKGVKVELDQAKLSFDKFAQPASDEKITATVVKIQNFLAKNTAITKEAKAQLDLYLKELQSGISVERLNQINTAFAQTESKMRTMGKLGLAFKDQWTQAVNSFKVWISASSAVMLLVNNIRKIPKIVTELDSALVDLKKTTTMNSEQLESFYQSANNTAKEMGITTKEILQQASAWSRLGYSSEEAATKMAKYSAMFKMISPGMNLDQATDGLVSIMKAFKIGEDNVDDVVDGIMSKVNIVGNTQAINNSDIVDFLTRSSSAMAEANNTLEETIALGTAATEITRDADGVGNMLKTISMRIRGYDEETETYAGDVEELSGQIADLTKTASNPKGVSIFTDDSKTTYKSTYEILEDISNIYDDLDDKTQAQLLETLAGKRQGQAVAAIISNFDAAKKSMDSMANSAGNAEQEMSVAIDSIEYKANKLKETGTGIAQNLLGRDDAKAFLDVITKLAEGIDTLTNKLGLFGTAGVTIGTILGVKNVGRANYIS